MYPVVPYMTNIVVIVSEIFEIPCTCCNAVSLTESKKTKSKIKIDLFFRSSKMYQKIINKELDGYGFLLFVIVLLKESEKALKPIEQAEETWLILK